MNNKINIYQFPIVKRIVGSKQKTTAKQLSPSPRRNPFSNMVASGKLPKLHPISPKAEKLPKSPQRPQVCDSAPARIVCLKIKPRIHRISSPLVRIVHTPTFLDSN